MGKRLNFWPLAGFLTVSALGTLAHFAYEWSGKQLLAGAFCAVNESTWEHMKLLFFPALLFTMIQIAAAQERDGADPGGAGRQHHGGAASDPGAVLYLYWHSGPPCPLGGHRHFLSGRSADVPAGQPPPAAQTALGAVAAGGGAAVAVGTGVSVRVVDVPTAPYRPVSGSGDRRIRHCVKCCGIV